MKMLLATAALVTLIRIGCACPITVAGRVSVLWSVVGAGPSLCTCAFLWSAVALPN